MAAHSHDSLVITKSTELNGSQQELRPLLGMVRTKPTLVDWSLIARCEDELAALQLCVHLSRLANETIAFKLGIDKGHWSRIMQGRGHLPARKRTQLMSICGNLAPAQFDCMKFGFKMQEHNVEAELEEVEQRRNYLLAAKQQMEALAA
jgi:hypothetical protein